MHIGRIRDIKTLENDIQIKVRVCRLWRSKRFKPIMKNDGLQFILFDEMNDAIDESVKEAHYAAVAPGLIQGEHMRSATSTQVTVKQPLEDCSTFCIGPFQYYDRDQICSTARPLHPAASFFLYWL